MAVPVVSVITAAFNAAETIDSAIDSIQRQTFRDWELVIVDDASRDDTVEIVQGRAREDSRIRLIAMADNSGSGRCRNIAVENSLSDYIAVMDADDLSLPERLKTQHEFLKLHQSAAAVAGQLQEFGDWGGPVRSKWPTDRLAIEKLQSSNKMPLPHPSVMFRKASLLSAGGYDEYCRRAQDYALFLRLKNAELHCIPDVLVSYRTQRPISLGYAVANGRYAALARARADGSRRTEPRRLPFSAASDLRSSGQWIKRFISERATSSG
ncbi:MAG: glycosyltransferase [Alcaligenaceae bacterium]|nr:MAG: glycosyltransferase [Alcaligenaceae bacterium]